VPGGQTMVLRCIDVASSQNAVTVLCKSANGCQFWAARLSNNLGFCHAQWTGRQVFAGGDQFDAYTDVTASLMASGYLLTP
jgi:hypothetical protein